MDNSTFKKKYQVDNKSTMKQLDIPKITDPIICPIKPIYFKLTLDKINVDLNQNKIISNENQTKLDNIQEKLNKSKNLLDDKEQLQYYNSYMLILDLFSGLKRDFKEIIEHPSNAWFKCYELLSLFWPETLEIGMPAILNEKITSGHIAELPGSFVLAAHQYLLNNKYKHDFYFSSIVKNGVPFNDEYGLVKKYPNKFLQEYDGDLTDYRFVMDIKKKFGSGEFTKCQIVTGDLGIDSSSDYNKQEEINMKAHFGQTIGLLCMIAEGGLFIAKQFTMYREFTISIIGILSTMFDKFYLCKPLTSRPRNSEIYYIGIGFRRPDNFDTLLGLLIDRLKNWSDLSMLIKTSETNYLVDEIIKINSLLAENQSIHLKFINDAFGKFRNFKDLTENLKITRSEYNKIWIDKFFRKSKFQALLKSDYISD